MVQVFRPGKGPGKKGKKSVKTQGRASGKKRVVKIDHLDHEAKGVVPGSSVTFVSGALPGETCRIEENSQHKQVIKARAIEVMDASPHRIAPFCPHFDVCGGCQTQHADSQYLLQEKQKAIGHLLQKQTKLAKETLPWQAPLLGDERGYRRKLRLAVDARHQQPKIGFRGHNNDVVAISQCQVAEPALQVLLSPLFDMLRQLNGIQYVGHISLFSGVSRDGLTSHVYLTLRITKALSETDLALLKTFEEQQQCTVILDRGEQGCGSLQGDAVHLHYVLQSDVGDSLRLQLNPDDFVQVNAQVNQAMISQAQDWLDLSADDAVLDLFCGVGNFSLPLARQCRHVVGFEGVPEMVQMAQTNAQQNNIDNVTFISGDLSDAEVLAKMTNTKCNKVLLDPARAGAFEAVQQLLKMAPEAILYVSCNPATFGRDIAKILAANYQLTKLSLIDMFPQTAHTELMGLFTHAKK